MYKGYLIFVLVFLLIMGCGSPEENIIKEEQVEVLVADFSVDWLEGNWRDSSVFGGSVVYVENWKQIENNKFVGEKFQIARGNPSSLTELGLVKTEGLFYFTYIEEEKQTTFVQDSIGENFLSFVNTTDQFPANLRYQLNNDTLLISFSGLANGIFRSASFATRKTN